MPLRNPAQVRAPARPASVRFYDSMPSSKLCKSTAGARAGMHQQGHATVNAGSGQWVKGVVGRHSDSHIILRGQVFQQYSLHWTCSREHPVIAIQNLTQGSRYKQKSRVMRHIYCLPETPAVFLGLAPHSDADANTPHRHKRAQVRLQVHPKYATVKGSAKPCHLEPSCAPRVPAPRHRRGVLQPQRLQAAVRGEVCLGQLLILQTRQGGHELCRRGWRAGAAHICRQVRQDLLHLSMGESSVCWSRHSNCPTCMKET